MDHFLSIFIIVLYSYALRLTVGECAARGQVVLVGPTFMTTFPFFVVLFRHTGEPRQSVPTDSVYQ